LKKNLKHKKKKMLQKQLKHSLSNSQILEKHTNNNIEKSLDMNNEPPKTEIMVSPPLSSSTEVATSTTQTTQLQTTNSTTKEKPRIMNLSEVSVIRDILMGQQMADYERRFNSMETLIEAKDEATRHRISALEGELKAELTARFDKLEHLLLLNVEQLNQRMQSISRQDKNSLSELLVSLSQKLKE
jgi:hypothetical protein